MDKKKSCAGSLIGMIISFATLMFMLLPLIDVGGIKIAYLDYASIGNFGVKIIASVSIILTLYTFVHSILTLVSYKLRTSKYAKIGWEILILAGWLVFVPLVVMQVMEYIAYISSWAMWMILALMLMSNILASIFFGSFDSYKTYERKVVNKKLAITSLVLVLLSVVAIYLMFLVGVNDFEGTMVTTIILIALTILIVVFLALYLLRYHFSYNVVLLVLNICSLIMSIVTLVDLGSRVYIEENPDSAVPIREFPAGANFVESLIIVIPFIINLVMSIILLVRAKKIKGNEPTK